MRKLLGFVLVFLIALGCAYFYALYFYIPERIKSGFTDAIARAGFERFSYEESQSTAGLIIFRGITLDEKGFTKVEQVDVRYSPFTYLFQGGVADFIRVHRLRLTGEVSNDFDFSFAGWTLENGVFVKLAALSSKTLIFEGAAIDLYSPNLGGLKVLFDGQVKKNEARDGELAFLGRVKSQQKKFSFDASIMGTFSEKGVLDLKATADELQFDLDDFKLHRASAEITLLKYPDSLPTIAMRGPATSLKWRSLPFGDMNFVFERKDGEMNLFAEGKTLGPEKIDFSIGIKSGADGTNYDIVANPRDLPLLMTFLQRNALFKDKLPIPPLLANLKAPTLSLSFDDTLGKSPDFVGTWTLESEEQGLSIEGEFRRDENNEEAWLGNCTKASFTEEVEEGSLAPPFYTDIPLDCSLSWDGKTTPPGLTWTIKAVIENEELLFGPLRLLNIRGQVGEKYLGNGKAERRSVLAFNLPIKKGISHKGRIVLNLDADGSGLIKSLVLYIYGGQVRVDNFDLKGLSFPSKMVFKITDINLTDYLGGLNISGLTVYGHLGGVIPLTRTKGKLSIKDGLLQSQAPGIIKLPETLSNTLFPGSDPQMQTIREALNNYHYEFFELRFDGTVSGGVMVSLYSRGTNPDMVDKRPIEMNFQIETEISVLVEHMLAQSSKKQP
ncbi:MAG: YdbH domain-containing protein [Alphaproteobacteria bacterium]|nr:YdbH domain-containing protein [Alphaproteobacteria bacterium]MCB9975507.1 YdbH domain-containing protein [Rhodospirillales bacterium]